MFNDDDILLIQQAIAGNIKLNESENNDLIQRIKNDASVKKYGMLTFFPYFREKMLQDKILNAQILAKNRGLVYIVNSGDGDFVIKPTENPHENGIAKKASESKIGPEQYISIENYLTEEFVNGNKFTYLPQDYLTGEKMYIIGMNVGNLLLKLHKQNIVFNDTSIADDFSNSHTLIGGDLSTRLIDFGAAFSVENHPDYDDSMIFQYIRTKPFLNMIDYSELTEEKKSEMIKNNLQELRSMTKEEVLDRDIEFIHEGLQYASYKYSEDILHCFLKGFRETYKR